MKISYDANPAVAVPWISGAQTHWRVIFEQGIVQPGSSGSPLFNQSHRIVGQLHGNQNNQCWSTDNNCHCNQTPIGEYGRFDISWIGGGTNSTRLSNWLDPLGTNPNTLDGITEIPLPSITGPEYVCSSSTSTFTVNNLPSNISVSWTVSPDLQIVGSTANSVSVQKKSFSSTNSNNWIQATVLNYPVRKNITVWQSGIQDYMVNQEAMQGYAYCTGGNLSVYYPAGRSLGGSNFMWSSSCDWTPSYQGYFTTDFSGNDCGTASVYITVNFTDVCGSSSTIYKSFDIDCYTSYSAAYPNPASTELIIDKTEEDNNIELQSNIKTTAKPSTVKVLLYSHATTKLVFSKDCSSEDKQIKIDTSKLPNGVYYLNIIENGKTIKEQTIVINH